MVGDWVLRYYSPAKKCKLDSAWVGPYLVVSLADWVLGIQLHPDSPIILVNCRDLKNITRPSGLVSWIDAARPEGVPTIPLLGASTMGRTIQGSPSVAVMSPDEGAVLSEIVSVKSAKFFSGSRSDLPDASGMDVSSAALSSAVVTFPKKIILVDATSNLHPFVMHRLDAGPIRLATIAHAFNYRVAVLRDGVRSAARFGCSRKAEGLILEDTDVSLGSLGGRHVSDSVCACVGGAGISPWGHVNHSGGDCECLSSDCTGAYVHNLALMPQEYLTVSELEDASYRGKWCAEEPCIWYERGAAGIGAIRVSSPRRLWLPAPGCLCVMEDGPVGDWLRPVMRGAGGRAYRPKCTVWLTSAY